MTFLFKTKGVGTNALNEFQAKESRVLNLDNFNRKQENNLK